MRDLIVYTALGAAVLLVSLARDLHRRAARDAAQARRDLTAAVDAAGAAHRDHLAARHYRAIAGERVDGPSGLTDLFVRKYGWDPLVAAEVANTAVWHLESPLVAALTTHTNDGRKVAS